MFKELRDAPRLSVEEVAKLKEKEQEPATH